MATNEKFWIKKAIKKPGALRATVMREFGEAGFTEEGTIKQEVLSKLAKGRCPVCFRKRCICPTTTTRRRARFAQTLKRLRA